jgi:hypothetical protein
LRFAKSDRSKTVHRAGDGCRERRTASAKEEASVPWVFLLNGNGAQCRQVGVTAA